VPVDDLTFSSFLVQTDCKLMLRTAIYQRLPVSARRGWARVDTSALAARLMRGTFWSLAGTAISQGLALAASMAVARTLGKVGFGEFGILQSTTGMFSVFAGFGLGLTSTKYVAEFRTKDPVKASRIMTLSAVVAWVTSAIAAAALWIAAPWLAQRTLAAPHLTPELRLSCLLVLLGGVNGAQKGALGGFESFRTLAQVNLLTGLAGFPLLVLSAWTWGLAGAVWGLVASLAVSVLLNNLALRKESARAGVPLLATGWARERDVLWKFSLPALLTGVAAMPVYWICSAILVRQPQGYSHLAVFTAAFGWRQIVLLVPGSLGAALTPVLAALHGDADGRRFRQLVWRSAAVSAALALAAAAPLALLSPFIMAAYGPGFRSGGPVLLLIAMVAVLMAVVAVLCQTLGASGRNWLSFGITVLWGGITVALMLAFRKAGATGFATAVLLSHVVHLCTNALCVRFCVTPTTRSTPERPVSVQDTGSL